MHSVALGEISTPITKGATPTTYGFQWQASGVPFLRSECVSEKGLDMRQSMFISSAAHASLQRSQVVEGDILLTITGNIGRVVQLEGIEEANINQHIARVRVIDERLHPRYVFHYLSQRVVRRYYESITTGQAYPQISLAQVQSTSIPLISKTEQKEIVAALDDADKLINSLERLISKKHAIKQGMMQELLTGRTRLPGFKQAWSRATLGRISKVTMGQSPVGSSYNTKGNGLPLIQGNADVSKRATIERVWTSSPTKISEPGNVILTVRAPVGHAAIASHRICLGRGVCGLDAGKDNSFLFHLLVSNESRWSLFSQGSTFTAVGSNEVNSFTIDWPCDPEERSAIAKVLQDADQEIDALQRRLESVSSIKQGMMQELLTGRVRLPVGGEAR
ncbi:restriction endonuclease subunit S [Corynebacterium auriscanis]|uniref:restriction endonuclease subunit S n=1 Tax=Corynebacterium auriscanis TaxID=99807 RepID=UPI003CF3D659